MKSIDGSTLYFDVFRQELYMIYMTTIQTSHLHGTHIPRNMIHRGFPPSLPSSNHVCIDVIQFNTIHDHSCTVYSYHTLQSYSHFTPIIIIIYYPWPTIFFRRRRSSARKSASISGSWTKLKPKRWSQTNMSSEVTSPSLLGAPFPNNLWMTWYIII